MGEERTATKRAAQSAGVTYPNLFKRLKVKRKEPVIEVEIEIYHGTQRDIDELNRLFDDLALNRKRKEGALSTNIQKNKGGHN